MGRHVLRPHIPERPDLTAELEKHAKSASPPEEPDSSGEEQSNQQEQSAEVFAGDLKNPEDWLFLKGRSHGVYSYPDLVVSMHRLGYDAEVGRVAESLGFHVGNTGQEQDGTAYIGSIRWEEALKLNLTLGNFTLNPRQGLDLLIDVKKGISGERKLYDALGNKVGADRLRVLYNEIVEVRSPRRSEWLDARFGIDDGKSVIFYNHVLDAQRKLKPRIIDDLLPCLQGDDYFNLDKANGQGLATSPGNGEMTFWCPADGAVAGFDAGSDWAGLDCNWNPNHRYDSLGVRAVRRAGGQCLGRSGK